MVPRINWQPNRREMMRFGVTILLGFAVIGGIAALTGRVLLGTALWTGAGAVCVLSIVAPRAAKPAYWIWMGAALVMGTIASRIVLVMIFFGVLTPLAFFFRLVRRDALELKKPVSASYWKSHPPPPDPSSYDHIF